MSRRTLQASAEGIKKIKAALKKKKWTQDYLAGCVGCHRQTIWSLLKGNPIDYDCFIDICSQLKLEQNEIVKDELIEENQQSKINIDVLVQEVRQKIKPFIQERCGTMRVLDMTQPIGLNDIYTKVNILEKITGLRRKEIADLLQEYNCEDFERFGLGKIQEKRVPGLEAVEKYPKLMILGKPGAGKTTFLKYLAIQCIEGSFQPGRVPIFITLKDFAEAKNKPNFMEYISQQYSVYGVTTTQVNYLFKHGRAIILLDGLDEVREEDSYRIVNHIRDFYENYSYSDEFKIEQTEYSQEYQNYLEEYSKKRQSTANITAWLRIKFPNKYYRNFFIITCRIAAKEYTFETFSEVEVADFDDEQIATFANNWFKYKTVKSDKFLQRLAENRRIYELATNPLLLTLLCLVFEESGDFPANRSELYKEGIDALLKKWDAKRGIYRDQVYKKLSVQRKEDLLSKIALNTFERSDYFFKQKVAEQHIIEYIRNLPDASTDPEALQLDSERVLKSLEAQHGLLVERAKGIYSFSHLTFHEYFTAREFITVQQSSAVALKNLLEHMMAKRWREVFFLALGMSPSADHLLLLMKKKVDVMVAADEELQEFLIWVNQKSISVNIPYKLVTVRTFYFTHNLVRVRELVRIQDLTRVRDLVHDLFRNLNLTRECDPICDVELIYDFNLVGVLDLVRLFNFMFVHDRILMRDRVLIRNLDHVNNLNPQLKSPLQQLRNQLPNTEECQQYEQWWETNGKKWAEQLRAIMIKYRNIGHDWQFSEQQKELLQQYYDANKLLVECLNSDCYVSREVRQYIEDTLLLPNSEIEKYPKPNL
ncbi:NACHT domain-containing NTPase [Aerosakkonemataceae cyanobacterium BLCC-F154]|uniref:NACHT domain-containing NTPase n=1 Tax=Floridaenema fluviatile BLCC-F154 TaxID=3153640 RepID=A0ABV4YEQ1_9CYAN